MTCDELRELLKTQVRLKGYDSFQDRALLAVVEKHTPFTPEFGGGIDYCWADDRPYPCPTIQAIEKELK